MRGGKDSRSKDGKRLVTRHAWAETTRKLRDVVFVVGVMGGMTGGCFGRRREKVPLAPRASPNAQAMTLGL